MIIIELSKQLQLLDINNSHSDGDEVPVRTAHGSRSHVCVCMYISTFLMPAYLKSDADMIGS